MRRYSGCRSKTLQRGLGIAAEDRRACRAAPRGERAGFNGASASLPRIARGERVWCVTNEMGFNGASASLPRIDLVVAHVVAPFSSLQRGLGIAAEDRQKRNRASHPVHLASTGPRHRCRGSKGLPHRVRRDRASFNGASASLPRIEQSARRPHVAQFGFNGASASLPRIGLDFVMTQLPP